LVVTRIWVVSEQIGARAQVTLQVTHRSTVVAKTTQLVSQLVVLRRDHPALTRSNGFSRMETEAPCVAKRSYVSITVSTAEATSGILDHPKIVTMSKIKYPIHLSSQTEEVDRQYRSGSRGNEAIKLGNV
jgi:hypothetical protein